MTKAAVLLLVIGLGLAACAAPAPHMGVGVSPGGVAVTPSVSTTVETGTVPLRVGISPSGPRLSTGLGPLGIGLRL